MANDWDAQKILEAAYEASKSKDIRVLEQTLQSMELPGDGNDGLEQLTRENWKKVIDQHRETVPPTDQPPSEEEPKNRSILLLAIPVGVVVLALLIFAGLYMTGRIFPPTSPQQPTQVAALSTVPATQEAIQATATDEPTSTPVPPTPTSTAAPAVDEGDAVADTASIVPALPSAYEKVWTLDYIQSVANPAYDVAETWKKVEAVQEKQQEFMYTETGKVKISWEKTLNPGLYQFFVNDTLEYSGGANLEVNFQVQMNGTLVQPRWGASSVRFNNKDEARKLSSQQGANWLQLGIYEVPSTLPVKVSVEVPELSNGQAFAVDRLLIARLLPEEKQMLEMLGRDDQDKSRVLVSLLDDPLSKAWWYHYITVKPEGGFYDIPLGGQMIDASIEFKPSPVTGLLAWGDSFKTYKGKIPYAALQLYWNPFVRLAQGKYEIMVWVPSKNATALVRYSLVTDDKTKIEGEGDPGVLKQGDYPQDKSQPGQWVSVGTWNVKEEVTATVLLETVKDELKDVTELGWDAVAIIRVNP